MRRLAAYLAAPLLVLTAACGDATSDNDDPAVDDLEALDPEDMMEDLDPVEPAEDSDILDAVEVSGEVGEEPEVTVDGTVESDETARRVLVEGDGETYAGDTLADVDFALYNGEDGAELDTSYDVAPMPMPFSSIQFEEGIGSGLMDVPLGSRVLVALPPIEDEMMPMHPDLEGGETLVAVFDVLEARERGELPELDDVDNRAEGTEVEPEPGLPEVTLDDEGAPSIEVPDGDAPDELVTQVLIEGDGEEVPRGATIIAQYTGVLWEDGSVFDSSWDRPEPAIFGLDQVIQGWSMGLAGQTVGSQVLLVIPADLAYGEMGSEPDIPPDAPLVFVVDILATD